jgi:hypothetical protein
MYIVHDRLSANLHATDSTWNFAFACGALFHNLAQPAMYYFFGFMHKKPTREVSGPILWGVEEQVNKGT